MHNALHCALTQWHPEKVHTLFTRQQHQSHHSPTTLHRRVFNTALVGVLGTAVATPLALPPRATYYAATAMDNLIAELQREGRLQSPRLAEAMRAVDRATFVPHGTLEPLVYTDTPLPLGYGETISAPHMHAACLDLLERHLVPGAHVLDVGSGSGFLTAVMGVLVGPTGRVVGVEKHPELAKQSEVNIRAAVPELLNDGTISIRAGNVLEPGICNKWGPFDAIHVGAAADTLPRVLVEQLQPGGRMVIPVGPRNDYQVLQVVDKGTGDEEAVRVEHLFYVRYVPLTHPHEGT